MEASAGRVRANRGAFFRTPNDADGHPADMQTACRIAMALLGSMYGFPAQAFTEQQPTLTVPVAVQDYANLPDALLYDAQRQASDIFRTVGVVLGWGTAGDKDLRIVILPPQMAARIHASDDALGFTPSTLSGAGRRTYVFAERVKRSAKALHLEFAHLLGCAIAHELGHMLLPRNPHSDTGIMRADWDPQHLSVGTSDYLHFTPWQEEWIRRNAAAFASKF
jgi:hypothetical protein